MPNRSKYDVKQEDEPNNRPVLLKLSPTLVREFKAECKRDGETMSGLMRRILREWIDNQRDRRARWAQYERGQK